MFPAKYPFEVMRSYWKDSDALKCVKCMKCSENPYNPVTQWTHYTWTGTASDNPI